MPLTKETKPNQTDTGKYKYIRKQVDSVVQIRTVLLTSDFGSLREKILKSLS